MDPFKHLLNTQAGDISWVSCVLLLAGSIREFQYILKPGLFFQNLHRLITICHNYSDYIILLFVIASTNFHSTDVRFNGLQFSGSAFLKYVAASVRFQISSGSKWFELRSCTPQSPVSFLTFLRISVWMSLVLMSCYSLFCPFIL